MLKIIFLESLELLSEYCSEFLIHAADVEGLCKGIDEELVRSTASCFFDHLLLRYFQDWVNG